MEDPDVTEMHEMEIIFEVEAHLTGMQEVPWHCL